MSKKIPLCVVATVINDTYHNDIVQRALEYAPKSPSRRKLRDEILKIQGVPGFRDANKAPIQRIIRPVKNVSRRSNEMMAAVLQVWLDSHSDLKQMCEAYLEDMKRPARPLEKLGEGFTEICTIQHMDELVQGFCTASTVEEEFAPDDVFLMLYCLTGTLPFPDEKLLQWGKLDPALLESHSEVFPESENSQIERLEGDAGHEALSMKEVINPTAVTTASNKIDWHVWLADWKALDPLAAEWDFIEEFITSLSSIADEKLTSRRAEAEALQQKIDAFKILYADDMAYFEIDIDLWNAKSCPLSEVSIRLEELDALQKQLDENRRLKLRSAKTRREELEYVRDLSEAGETILALCSKLARTFVSGAELIEQLSLPSPQAVTPRTDEAAQDEGTSGLETPSAELVVPAYVMASDLTSLVTTPGSLDSDSEIDVSSDRFQPSPLPVLLAGEADLEGPQPELFEAPRPKPKDLPSEASNSFPDNPQVDTPLQDVMPESDTQPIGHLVTPHLSPPTQTLSVPLSTDLCSGSADSLLWAMIAEDDLSAAYWIAKSAYEGNQISPVPPWLLAAMQAARWITPENDTFMGHLKDIAQKHAPGNDQALGLLGLSAAVSPILIAPDAGTLIPWLQTPDLCPPLHPIIAAIADFANRGQALRPMDLRGAASEVEREAAIAQAAEAARRWLQTARQSRPSFVLARGIWDELRKTVFEEAFGIVASDDRAQMIRIHSFLQDYGRRESILAHIHEVNRQLHKKRAQEIVGNDRDKMIRDVQEGAEILRTWLRLVADEKDYQARGDWMAGQVAKLRRDLEHSWADSMAALSELMTPSVPEPTAAAAKCLQRSLNQIGNMLNLFGAIPGGVDLAPLSMPLSTYSFPAALGERLLLLPELLLEDDGQPAAQDVPNILISFQETYGQNRTANTALDLWVEKQDYRFVSQLQARQADMLGEEDSNTTDGRIRKSKEASNLRLREKIKEAEYALNKALSDGIVLEENYSRHSAHIIAIRPDDVLNFPKEILALDRLQDELHDARHLRVEHLCQSWESFQKNGFPNASPEHWERIQHFVQDALDAEDTRLVDECLSHLREAREQGKALEEAWFNSDRSQGEGHKRRELEHYLELLPRLLEWQDKRSDLKAAGAAIRIGQTVADIAFGQIPTKRRVEAADAIERWRQIKQGPQARDIDNALGDILRFLGFTDGQTGEQTVVVKTQGADWVRARAVLSAGTLSRPIPQFGSQAAGVYDIVCLFDRPGADTISSRLKDLKLSSTSPIVFYLGRLKLNQRLELLNATREEGISPAILDETLLLFLAGEREARLPVFLRCSLPFTALKPYTPDRAGDVADEMFFGRRDEIAALQDSNGPCLVYGGRQLGKSALLMNVKRQFHDEKQDRYACVEDIKRIGSLPLADQPTDRIWQRLRDEFVRWKLLKHVGADKSETIARQIREVMEGNPSLRVLVMFDEADNFLDADAQENFRVVDNLRKLMTDTERRFKVVFAGLHQVQRFTGISNQPLAHFGEPIRVGPLDMREALRLVRRPLETLGFRPDEATALRILSYTNYHPGLIQKFCYALLTRMNARSRHKVPSVITQADVEAIYQDPNLRAFIRERFELTLALDSRYQAIAWSMVEAQMAARDSYAEAFEAPHILARVEGLWPAGFDGMRSDDLRVLLEEMCGLGVLVRTEGRYRLRSPNLVRLMGTDAEIERKLLELIYKPRELSQDAASLRPPLDEKARHYSPLTYAQERILNPSEFGVGLVLASEALGDMQMETAIERFVPAEMLSRAGVATIPASVTSAGGIKDWLQRHLQENKDSERLVTYQRVAANSTGSLEGRVRGALSYCKEKEKRTRKQWVRVIFLLPAPAAWAWVSQPPAVLAELERLADAVVSPHRWNATGVRQRLEQHEIPGSEPIIQEVLAVTGGWPFLLDRVFNECSHGADVRGPLQRLANTLKQPGSELRNSFIKSLGVKDQSIPQIVLTFLKDLGPSEPEIVHELMADPKISADQCASALEFLVRMGCVQRRIDKTGAEIIEVEPTVSMALTQL